MASTRNSFPGIWPGGGCSAFGEKLPGPDGIVPVIFPGFKRYELIDEFLADQAGKMRGVGRGGSDPLAREEERRGPEQQEDQRDREEFVRGAVHAAGG